MTKLEDILASIPVVASFPRPDWDQVTDWLHQHYPEGQWYDIGSDLARQWLAAIRDAAGSDYEFFESPNFLFLTPHGESHAISLARVAERALREMTEGLPGVASKPQYGKFVCLVFGDIGTYYEYLSYYYPEGEFGASAGVYLSRGYPHFALSHAERDSQEFAFVHELTHACLEDCPLPLWLEEGVTQTMEESILGFSSFVMNREEHTRHQAFWSEYGLQDFWLGRSFQRPDDGMELSYSLAQVFTRNLISRGRPQFLRLLEEASPGDCGDQAVRGIYGFGLGDLARQFLGEGNWNWDPAAAREFTQDDKPANS